MKYPLQNLKTIFKKSMLLNALSKNRKITVIEVYLDLKFIHLYFIGHTK